jgi:HK97 family phage portal protein
VKLRGESNLLPRAAGIAAPARRKQQFFWGLWQYSASILRNRTFWPFGAGASQSAPPINLISSASGINIDQAVVLTLSTAWACTWRYANTIGTLPLFLMRTGPQNTATVARDLPLYTILHDKPNEQMSAASFWQSMVASMFLWGNGYALKLYNSKKELIGLKLLRPEYVTPYLRNEQMRYDYSPGIDAEADYSADQVFHLFHRSLDGLIGTSQIQFGADSLGLALSAERTSSMYWKNGVRASGFIKTNTWLTPKQRADYRASVMGFLGQSTGASTDKHGGVMIIENASDFQPITMKPVDVELLASRRFSVEDVCRFWDLPPVLVGHAAEGQTMWGTGISEIILGWFKLGLTPILRCIEQGIWRQLLTPEQRLTLFAEFNLEALLRGDPVARASFYSQMAQNGVYTRNEIRAKENLPPDPDGDQLTVQSNLTPLADLGAAQEQAATQVQKMLRQFLGVKDAD